MADLDILSFSFIIRIMSKYSPRAIGRFSEVFRALSNPHRLQIYLRLTRCCAPGTACSTEAAGLCVGQIGEGLDIAPSTLSHHLKELSRAGLVQMERNGQRIDCRVDTDTLGALRDFLKLQGQD